MKSKLLNEKRIIYIIMNSINQKRMNDLKSGPDKTQYEVMFYVDSDNGLNLYETLLLDSPPEIPNEGEYMQVEFIVDDDDNEVFRSDGYINSSDIGSDEKYTHLTSPEFKIKQINTSYEKHVTENKSTITTVKKMVILTDILE